MPKTTCFLAKGKPKVPQARKPEPDRLMGNELGESRRIMNDHPFYMKAKSNGSPNHGH